MPRDRRGRFTAERTTTERTITERVTIHHDPEDDTDPGWGDGTIPGPIPWAAGWDSNSRRHAGGNKYREHRRAQVERALDAILVYHLSADLDAETPPWVIGEAVTMLRAGPAATLSELTTGRSV